MHLQINIIYIFLLSFCDTYFPWLYIKWSYLSQLLTINQDFKYKRKITQLEYELQVANNKFIEYESQITDMEQGMMQIQKAWSRGLDHQVKVDTRDTGTGPEPFENKHALVQTTVVTKSGEIQTDPYTCCLDKKETVEVEVQTTSLLKHAGLEDQLLPKEVDKEKAEGAKQTDTKPEKKEDVIYASNDVEQKGEVITKERETTGKRERKDAEEIEKKNGGREISLLREQLNQALKLASDRSATVVKYELQITEYQRKVDSLNRMIETKDLQLTKKEELLEEYRLSPQLQPPSNDCSDKLALKSTINSLQKLLGQKEDTITRYQNLLKEDRDEHSKAAARLQEQIKSLHSRLQMMENEAQKTTQQRGIATFEPEKFTTSDKTEEIVTKSDVKGSAMQAEEVARLHEKVSTLEADLSITKELSDRWHRLAEERLKHMDRMRERYGARLSHKFVPFFTLVRHPRKENTQGLGHRFR